MQSLEVRLPIRLGQFLKLANFAESGAEARDMIEMGVISVNNECEKRRGRQLADGDVITLDTAQGALSIRVVERES